MNPFGHMVSEISSTVIICFFVSEVVLNVGAAEEKRGHLNKTSTLDDASSSAAVPPFPQRRKQR